MSEKEREEKMKNAVEKDFPIDDLTVWEWAQVEALIQQHLNNLVAGYQGCALWESEISRFDELHNKIRNRGKGAEGGFLLTGDPLP